MAVTSDDFRPPDREPFGREEICPHLYRVETDSVGGDHFRFLWDVRDVGEIGFAHVEASVTRRARTCADIARDGYDAIAVQRAVGGPVEVAFARETMTLADGDWLVLAMDWACEMRASSGSPGGRARPAATTRRRSCSCAPFPDGLCGTRGAAPPFQARAARSELRSRR